MSALALKVIDGDDRVRCVSAGEDEAVLVYASEYREGDRVCLEINEPALTQIEVYGYWKL